MHLLATLNLSDSLQIAFTLHQPKSGKGYGMESGNPTVDGINPVPTASVNPAIQDRLKRFIFKQHLGAGCRLPPEGRLSRSFGVSRPALWKTLRALEALGTVEFNR
jgi:hypothetical protein